jgi:hypothetical protein
MAARILRLGGVLVLAAVCFGGRLAAQPPQGIEVLARGPVHEAFATPTAQPEPTQAVPRQPPPPLEELPPDEKPDGDCVWVNGYWAWDDDRNDFLWVSGIWRTPPPGKSWVPGYWRDAQGQWQYVPGFWTVAEAAEAQSVTYLPAPPAPPLVAPPGPQPVPDSFYVPGTWVWSGDTYAWRAGYWARVQPGYVWVAAHYRWTPGGYIYIGGYWDLAVARRGVLFAPVVISPSVVRVGFVYTPAYVVSNTIVMDSLFVRTSTCHYYFGDYYEPRYRTIGFESAVVYSQRSYDPIVVYHVYEHREDPTFISLQINLFNDRSAGRAPVPPRTLMAQQNIVQNTVVQNNVVNNNVTVVNNYNTVIAPVTQMSTVNNIKTVQVTPAQKAQVVQHAQAVRQVAAQRTQSEVPVAGGKPTQPRVATLNVPPPTPNTPRPNPTATAPATPTHPGTPAAGR